MVGFYPCQECIVLPCCTKLCYKVTKKRTDAIKKSLDKSICPDCGGIRWRMNIDNASYSSIFMCEECNHKFNSYGGRYY
jgi:hypothetical protein